MRPLRGKIAVIAALTGFALIAVPVGAGVYSRAMQGAHGAAPDMAPAQAQADRITVSKSARRLVLWQGDRELARYPISLGAAPAGHKQQEGDERTPEGRYVIDWRNPQSRAFLSLHISYPDAQDRADAQAAGRDPGGMIMIHGLPNGWGFLGALHRRMDWTDGCIAVTNDEMREIWSRVPNGTPIEITG